MKSWERIITLFAALITILQFALYGFIADTSSPSSNFILPIAIETKTFIFLLIEIAILYLSYPIANLLITYKTGITAFFVMALNCVICGYFSTVNFKIFWGEFHPLPPPVSENFHPGYFLFLAATGLFIPLLVTKIIAEDKGAL